MTPKPDSRLPWRVVYSAGDDYWQVFSADNDCVADFIPIESEAQLIAQAPELQTRVQSLTTAKDAALAILERLRVNLYGGPVPQFDLCREAIEVLNRIISYE